MKRLLMVLLVLVLLVSGIAGCAKKSEEPAAPAANQQQQQQAASTQTGGDQRLSDLVKAAGSAKQMSFDMVMTMNGSGNSVTSTGKMYISDKKVRMEMETMGMKMITIVNAQGEVYMYNPASQSAMKIAAPTTQAPNSWLKENGDTTGLTVVGEEKKDGYDCLVVTSTQDGNTAKMWMRKDIGMPIRIEQNTPQGQAVMEYKNYNIGSQPDSLFEIPAGTQITTMPTGAAAPTKTN